MSRQRYSPRFTGFAKQFLEQAVKQNAVKVNIPPVLREKLKEKMNITDEDIDKAIQEGTTEFIDGVKEIMTAQREELASLKESIKNDEQ